jgi:hypothetical protein
MVFSLASSARPLPAFWNLPPLEPTPFPPRYRCGRPEAGTTNASASRRCFSGFSPPSSWPQWSLRGAFTLAARLSCRLGDTLCGRQEAVEAFLPARCCGRTRINVRDRWAGGGCCLRGGGGDEDKLPPWTEAKALSVSSPWDLFGCQVPAGRVWGRPLPSTRSGALLTESPAAR